MSLPAPPRLSEMMPGVSRAPITAEQFKQEGNRRLRLHTNHLTERDLFDAARKARVDLEKADRHGSRSQSHAFEVSLRGESNRRPNFYNGDGSYAATWDQWGVFLAALYKIDPYMVAGSVKHPAYADARSFHHQTGLRFLGTATEDGFPHDYHGDHTFRFNGVPRENSCTKCSATRRWGF